MDESSEPKKDIDNERLSLDFKTLEKYVEARGKAEDDVAVWGTALEDAWSMYDRATPEHREGEALSVAKNAGELLRALRELSRIRWLCEEMYLEKVHTVEHSFYRRAARVASEGELEEQFERSMSLMSDDLYKLESMTAHRGPGWDRDPNLYQRTDTSWPQGAMTKT